MTAREGLKHLNEKFRQGRFDEVRKSLREIRTNEIPRELITDFAGLARRVGLLSRSLRWMQPILYPLNPSQAPASAQEIATYATGLSAIGALPEARSLLESVQNSQTPEVLLALAFLHVHTWNYEAAIPLLEKYLLNDSVTDYQKVVARVNLAAGLSFMRRSEEVIELVSSLYPQAAKNGWNFIGREALLIMTQGQIQSRRWEAAEASLSQAAEVSREWKLPVFLLRKWRTLLELQKQGANPATLQALRSLKMEAISSRSWETLRDCDYYEAFMTHDSRIMERVYFGTPFIGYRQRILRDASEWVSLSSSHVWQHNPQMKERRHRADLKRGAFGKATLPEDELTLRIVRVLSSDFYRPIKIGTLFTALYPDEVFIPLSSPGRVRTAITRARRWFEEVEFPLEIKCAKNEYSLNSNAPCSLRVAVEYPRAATPQNSYATQIAQLKTAWPYKAFTTTDAALRLKLSVEKTRDVLKAAEEKSSLLRVGAGRGTMFRFAK